jgi:hypothetical protein
LRDNWRTCARHAGFSVTAETINVRLGSGRQQAVHVDESSEAAVRLWSVILPPQKTSELGDGRPLEFAWERNRLSDLMGFSVDQRGRLIGETWIALDGMTTEAVALHVGEVARICDWQELRLAATDDY